MTTQEWLMLIGAIVLFIVAIAAVVFSVMSKKHISKALSAGLAEVSEYNVTVKNLLTDSEGEKKNYFVIFESEENGELKISVNEEIFADFNIGEKGLLTLADGELLSFVIDG